MLNLGYGLSGGGIGEMAMARLDTLFDRPRTFGIFLEQSVVVVGLYQETLNATKGLGDKGRSMTEIGQKSKRMSV
jgi:hypothetical protein